MAFNHIYKRTLAIDIETYCPVDLMKAGAYRYAEDPDFEILLFGYAYDDEPVTVLDLTGGKMLPADLVDAIMDPHILKTAFNAQFERVCLSWYIRRNNKKYTETLQKYPRTGWAYLLPESWKCSMIQARYLALPSSLAEVGKALHLTEQKGTEGKALIRYFCNPCKATKVNGGRVRNLPADAPDKWAQFTEYNVQDVTVERELRKRLDAYPVPRSEWELWWLDQRINDRGVASDPVLVEAAMRAGSDHGEIAGDRLKEITGLDNPGSVVQLKGWLAERGVVAESLAKDKMKSLLEDMDDDEVSEALGLRGELSKISLKKYDVMQACLCADGHMHGLLSFYGATRTGRWAGRLVQLQNLPRNAMADLDTARELLRSGGYEALDMMYGNVPKVLSELIRTVLVPSAGCRFIVSDFSAIEARVIAWVAGEKWRMDVFATTGKIYEASAAAMFGVPMESIGHDSQLRQKGKVAELACGYGGGVNALKQMGADKMGLGDAELLAIIRQWRASSPRIVQLWRDLESAAMTAIETKGHTILHHGVYFSYEQGILFMGLPSGRRLAYPGARIEEEVRFNRMGITYMGKDMGAWTRLRTYGGKMTENLIQALARDCLAVAMVRVEAAGYPIVMHIHDEMILDMEKGIGSLESVNEIMAQPIKWAPGLKLTAAGFEAGYYKKD